MRVIGCLLLGLMLGVLVEGACREASAGLDVTPDLSGYAKSGQVPPPASGMPPATALDGNPGTSAAYARADHTHAARVQRTVITTASDGTATWTFARPIVTPAGQVPVIAYMVQDTGSPIVVQITARAWTSDGANDTHTAITIKASRARSVPAILTAVFDVFGGSAASVPVNLWAADPTQ